MEMRQLKSKNAVEIAKANSKKFAGVYDSKSKLCKPVDGGNLSGSGLRTANEN